MLDSHVPPHLPRSARPHCPPCAWRQRLPLASLPSLCHPSHSDPADNETHRRDPRVVAAEKQGDLGSAEAGCRCNRQCIVNANILMHGDLGSCSAECWCVTTAQFYKVYTIVILTPPGDNYIYLQTTLPTPPQPREGPAPAPAPPAEAQASWPRLRQRCCDTCPPLLPALAPSRQGGERGGGLVPVHPVSPLHQNPADGGRGGVCKQRHCQLLRPMPFLCTDFMVSRCCAVLRHAVWGRTILCLVGCITVSHSRQ